MNRPHALALALSGGALAIVAACAHQPPPDMQPNPGTGYVVETTGAVVGRDDPQRFDDQEPMLNEIASYVAGHICKREVQCHADLDAGGVCLEKYLGRAMAEIASWHCSPAGSRARLKTCLAAIDVEPCELDRAKRRKLCTANIECPDPQTRLRSPGAALADAGL